MEKRERLVLEIIAGAVFITILILVSIIVINASEQSKVSITNSYNTYNYNIMPAITEVVSTPDSKPYIVDSAYGDRKIYYVDSDRRYVKPSYSYLGFHDDARLVKTTSILGTEINNYEVYLRNREYRGGYFKVIYHFENYYGKTQSHAITHYIPAREEKRFLFKDVSPSQYKYRKWYYEIKSLSKAPAQVYYN